MVTGRQKSLFCTNGNEGHSLWQTFFLQTHLMFKIWRCPSAIQSSFAASVAAVIDSRNQMIDAMRNDSAYRLHHTATSLIVTPFYPRHKRPFTARSEGKAAGLRGWEKRHFTMCICWDRTNRMIMLSSCVGLINKGAELLESLRADSFYRWVYFSSCCLRHRMGI